MNVLLIACDMNAGAEHGVYKYNTNTNKWVLWIKYPHTSGKSYHIYNTITFNKAKNVLYLFGQELMIIHLNTKKVAMYVFY